MEREIVLGEVAKGGWRGTCPTSLMLGGGGVLTGHSGLANLQYVNIELGKQTASLPNYKPISYNSIAKL